MGGTVYDIWLSLAIGAGGRFDGLFENFETAEDVWRAGEQDLILSGIDPKLFGKLLGRDLRAAGRAAEFCARYGIRTVSLHSEDYPMLLRELEDPPYLLYVLGQLPDMDKNPGVGIVGTRRMTPYGMKNAYAISYELAAAGLVTVSGMAKGIDGTAAAATLEAGGRTVAVIGTGLDLAYPPEHRELMKEIAHSGAVVSEFAPESEPAAGHFPIRNRIISGLSRALFVAEAGRKSGAMLTAADAIKQGRTVFALPGRTTDPESEGPNSLICGGCRAAVSAGDILTFFAENYPGSFSEDSYARATVSSAFRPEALTRRGVIPAADPEAVTKVRAAAPKKAGEAGGTGVAAAEKRGRGKTANNGKTEEKNEEKPKEELLPEDSKLRGIYLSMPEGRPVSPDYFASRGMSGSEAVNLLSLLEITGFVKSVPGGMYLR